jgi:hypothetical protein
VPVLPASGYQTLQFPTQQPSIALATPPQDIPVTANMFGAQAGAALSEAGADFEKAAGHIDNIQTLHDAIAVDDQTTKMEDEINKIMYGDPNVAGDTGYKGLRGEEAIKAFPDVRNRINSVIQSHRGNMQNNNQMLKFDDGARRYNNYALQETGRHYDSEYKTWEAQTAEGRMTVNHGNIATAAASDNWDSFIQFVNKDQADVERYGVQTGMPREKIDAVKQERYKGAAKEWSQSLMSRDPVAADKFIENNKDALGDLYPDMKKENRARARAKQAEDDFLGKPSTPDMHRVIGGASPDGVPYTPSTDLKGGTGLNDGQWNTYRNTLGAWEGSYGSGSKPGHSYIGRYQFGQAALKETADRLGVPVPTEQQFLNDKQMQEQFLENYTLDHHNRLMQYSEYANASPTKRAGILAGSHLVGVDATIGYLRGGPDAKDGNGTRVSSYIHRMERAAETNTAVSPTVPGDPNPAPTKVPSPPPVPDAAPPAAPQIKPGGPVEVWGDSLGVGLKTQLGEGTKGTAVGGASPSKILANIKAQPEDYWQGKAIILPSGSNREANAADTIPKVEETIKYLQDHGARVIAVGYGTKQPERNAQLREIAAKYGVTVIDAEDDDGVHPSPRGYRGMVQKIDAALATAGSPVTPTVEPGSGTSTPPVAEPPVDAGAVSGSSTPPTPQAIPAPPPGPPQVTPIPPAAGGVDKYMPPPSDPDGLPDKEVPGLEAKLREFDKRAIAENWTQERYMDAYDYTRKRMNQAFVTTQHARTLERQQMQDNDNGVHDEYIGRMTSNSPNYPTIDEVKSDKRIKLPQTREAIIRDITTDSKPQPTKRDSDLAHAKLDERIWLPDGDPNQLNTENAIRQEYWSNHVTKEARDDLLTELAKKQDSQNAVLNNRARNLVESVERKIRPWKVMGDLAEQSQDPEGVERFRRFKENISQQIHDYRNPPPGQSAKNPADLFDSSKPDYLGSPDKLKDFLPAGGDPIKGLSDKPKTGAKAGPINLNALGTNPDPTKAIAEIRAALAAGQINPGQARAIAVQRGLAIAATPRIDLTPLAAPAAPAPAQPAAP